jgi:tetratricopeptide (TPR) repeat protein
VGTSTSLDGDDVRRRDLLAGLPAAVLLPAARTSSGPSALAAMRDSARRGLEVGGPGSRQARDQLAAAVRYCDLNFSQFPPAVLAGQVTGLRMMAGQMLRAAQTDSARRDLRVIAGWMSALSGNLAFVLADNTAALIHLSTAARPGTAAGDDDLVCWALGAQAMTASAQGRYAEALELARAAYEHAHSPLRRAQILAWAELRALAGIGDQHQAARAMAAAQDQMAADPHGERSGRFGFDLAELGLHLAEANLALGQHAQSRTHAAASTAHTRTGRPGWAAATLVLARGEAARGNHSDAAALAYEVLDTIPPQSLRQTSRIRLRDLDSDLSAATPVAAAHELHDRLRALPPLTPANAQ